MWNSYQIQLIPLEFQGFQSMVVKIEVLEVQLAVVILGWKCQFHDRKLCRLRAFLNLLFFF